MVTVRLVADNLRMGTRRNRGRVKRGELAGGNLYGERQIENDKLSVINTVSDIQHGVGKPRRSGTGSRAAGPVRDCKVDKNG